MKLLKIFPQYYPRQFVLIFLTVFATAVLSIAFSIAPVCFITAFVVASILMFLLVKPAWISYCFVIIMNLSYFMIHNGFFGNTSTFMLPDYYLLFIPVVWFFSRLIGISKKYAGTPVDLPILAFLCLASLSLLWTHDYENGNVQLLKLFVSLFGAFIIAMSTLTSEKAIRKLFWILFIIGIINSVLCFFSIYTYPSYQGGDIFDIGHSTIHLIFNDTLMVKNRGHAFSHPLTTATWINMVLFISVALFLTTSSKKGRFFIGLAMLFMLCALMTTMSKGPVIAMFCAFVLMLYFIRPLRDKIFSSVAVLIVSIILAFIIGNGYNLINLSNVTGHQLSSNDSYSSTASRLKWWKCSWEKGISPPGIGVGVGGLKQYLIKNAPHPHNTYISVFGELGVLGLALFLLICFIAFKTYLTALRRCGNEYFRRILLAYLAGYISLLLCILLNYDYTVASTWWYIGLGFVLVKISNDLPPDFHEEFLPYHEKGRTMVADSF